MIIGIDPGKSGGVAVLSDSGEFIDGFRMPTLRHGKRDLVDTAKLYRMSRVWAERFEFQFVIEQVGAMPKQGVSSTFNFGRHTGAVEGWAISTGKPVHWVTPAVWKRALNLGREKQASLDRARLEFGDKAQWKVKANDGIAEAALLALYWLRS